MDKKEKKYKKEKADTSEYDDSSDSGEKNSDTVPDLFQNMKTALQFISSIASPVVIAEELSQISAISNQHAFVEQLRQQYAADLLRPDWVAAVPMSKCEPKLGWGIFQLVASSGSHHCGLELILRCGADPNYIVESEKLASTNLALRAEQLQTGQCIHSGSIWSRYQCRGLGRKHPDA